MPVILIGTGLLAIIATIQGKGGALAKQLHTDFSGNPSFAYWVIAVLLIGSIGYIPSVQRISTLILVLAALSFVLEQNGVFTKFQTAVEGL